MINKNFVCKCCQDSPTLIENYDKAISDTTQTWDLHHRREISEGKSRSQLKAEGLYWQLSASELIFMTKADHIRLHKEGKHLSEETRAKMSAAKKGEKCYMFGKHMIVETRAKISATRKGQHLSPETRAKISAANKGEKNPMFGKPLSKDVRAKISATRKGKHMIIGPDGMRHWSI